MTKSPLSAATMSDHDSSSPPPPTSPPHVAAAAGLLLSPPTPVPPQTPLLVSTHPRADSEVPMTLPGTAPVAAPPPPLLLLPPPLVGHGSGSGGGGGATEGEHHLDFLPPGYRFHPQDDELVTHYLGNKVDDRPLPPNKIFDVRLYHHNPEYLAGNTRELLVNPATSKGLGVREFLTGAY